MAFRQGKTILACMHACVTVCAFKAEVRQSH
jgi:hypothetical protein